jgi:hypothetical protein
MSVGLLELSPCIVVLRCYRNPRRRDSWGVIGWTAFERVVLTSKVILLVECTILHHDHIWYSLVTYDILSTVLKRTVARKVGRRRRRCRMKVPPWCKPAFWGLVVGALGIMIIGFSWWGWVLGSTAERMATERAGAAVTAVLVPICVERFMGQIDAAAKLVAFQKGASWQQSQVIEKGGWATAAGSNTPNAAVAKACAHQLANSKT